MFEEIKKELRKVADKEKVKIYKRFFKTGSGEYGEGDQFIGVTVPKVRKIAKQFEDAPLKEVKNLLQSPIHEDRLTALIILTYQFKKGDEDKKEEIYRLYLSNSSKVNNWDLVDLSADTIVGGYLQDKKKDILLNLAKSKNVWERRIAVLATFHFIKNGNPQETLKLAHLLLKDPHDLIHKAVGWMLREVGKRSSQEKLLAFLEMNTLEMPRTMLRYAIERLPEEKRIRFLKKKV